VREFLVGFEAMQIAPAVAWPLWTLKTLIPFAGLLWLSRRVPFDGVAAWRPFVAALWLMAVWRSWPFLSWLAEVGLSQWLRRGTFSAALALKEAEYAGSPNVETFWLIFLTFVALTPAYFRAIQSGVMPWDDDHPGPSRLRWLGAAWTGVRVALGGAALLVLVAIARPDWLGLHSAPLSVGTAILPVLGQPGVSAVLSAVALSFFLLACGLRAWLVGLALLMVTLRLAVPLSVLQTAAPPLTIVHQMPYWAFGAALGVFSLPLMTRLVGALTPSSTVRRQWRWIAAAFLTAGAMLIDWLSVRLWLVMGGAVLFAAVVWLTVVSLEGFGEIRRALDTTRRQPLLVFAVALVGVLLVWPLGGPVEALRRSDVAQIAVDFRWLLVYVLALGLVLFMHDHARHDASVVLDASWRPVGIYLFSVLLINSSISWLLVPVPLIVALVIATLWLFQSPAEIARLATDRQQADGKKLLQGFLDAAAASTRLGAIQKVLNKKLDGAELTPDEYESRLGAYRAYLAKAIAGQTAPGGPKATDAVFGFGHSSLQANVRAALGIGALLAIPPVIMALYQYAERGVRYPYPVADVLRFLMGASASWLLYAFFFGYYYAHIRGTTGLTKGANLCSAIVLPFLAYRLLSTETLQDMWQFLLWAAQVFLFCTLMGLVAFDYRLLRANGFRARDLLAVHNVPVLYAYSSTVAAAVGSAVVAIITNRVTDLAKFFFDVIAVGGATKP
jgi:hypothetical protein